MGKARVCSFRKKAEGVYFSSGTHSDPVIPSGASRDFAFPAVFAGARRSEESVFGLIGWKNHMGPGKRIAVNLARIWASVAICLLCALVSQAATSGSISGTVKDPSGAVLPGVALTLKNTSLGTPYKTTSDANGYYSFPNLPVGAYDLTLALPGFKTMQKSGIVVDMDSALQINISMELAAQSQSVVVNSTVAAEQVQVETVATHLGEVVSDTQMTALPLNGRSYTDLLAIQPGVSPVTTLTPTSVIMAGVTGTINPSGDAESGRCFHQRPARIRQRFHGEWHRRAGAHERRHVGDPQPGFDRGISRPHQQFRSRVWQLQRRHDQRRHEIRQQRLPRRRLRISAQHGSRR